MAISPIFSYLAPFHQVGSSLVSSPAGKIGLGALRVGVAVASEVMEEVFVDPLLESYVSNTIKDMSGNTFWQIFGSTFAESFRETFFSMVTGVAKNNILQTQRQNQYVNTLQSIEQDGFWATQESISQWEADQQQRQIKLELIELGISSLLMFAGAFLSMSSTGFFGATIAASLITLGTMDIPVKEILNKITKADAGYLPSTFISNIGRKVMKEELGLILQEKISSLYHTPKVSKHMIEHTIDMLSERSEMTQQLIEKVNSEFDLLGNLVKKDRIDFTSEVVEKVYEVLPSEQKYIVDEVGDVWQLDPIGVVRTALEIMDYQLDPSWYAWGTIGPRRIGGTLYDALLNDLTDGTSLSIEQLSKKLFGDENHLTQVAPSLSKNTKNLGREVFQLLYELNNLDDNDPKFRTEDLTKLKQEKIAVIYLYLANKLYSGLSLELLNTFYENIFLESKNPSEKLMYFEILNGINKRVSDIDLETILQGNLFYMSSPNLDTHCFKLWGDTYRGLQTDLSQIGKRINNKLRNKLRNVIDFNGIQINYDAIRDELIAIGDIKNSQGLVTDLNGKIITNYDMVYLLLGRQDSFGGTKPVHNLLHLLAGHFESAYFQSDFSKIGLTDPKAVAELIFTVVESQQGVEVNSYLHRIVYKLEYHDKIEFLVLGLKGDKSIHTAFLADDTHKQQYNTMVKYNILKSIQPFVINNW